MGTFATLEEAKEYFRNDRFAANAGIQLDELSEKTSTCSLVLMDDHKNAYGGVMGGAIFTLADLAFAALANQIHNPSVASQVSINYLSATKGEKLFAKAKCLKDGKSTSVIQVDVIDDSGKYIACYMGNAFKL
ncbi:MAG: PaaI family thioesterase [Lachnospiraceae bacterium]|nr:PaaI family thioesterase [Lachnospiraceae bacterium]